MKIYFMYNFADRKQAEERIATLEENGFDVFHFSADDTRKHWKHIAKKKIKDCNYVCYYYRTQSFLNSEKNITWEYRTAQKFGKKVIFIDGNEGKTVIDQLLDEENKTLLKNLFNENYGETALEMNVDSFEKAQNTLIDKSNWRADQQVVHSKLMNNEIGGEEFTRILFEQYKLMVETSESLINRRQTTSNVYVGILSALLSLVGSSFALTNRFATGLVFMAVGVITFILSMNWRSLLINYSKNNEGKFAVINAIEERLPANLFDAEYNYNKLKSIVSYATRELTLCKLFSYIGVVILLGGAVITALALAKVI